jgi:diadenosine tetraphosphate (Ap4A) HIT family hydrolase
MAKSFILHPQLTKDTIHLLDWPLCKVLLMNDQQYPWLILVPQRAELQEFYQLELTDQHQLLQELNWASWTLNNCRPDKLNIATLGNVVPQLHFHVIARFKTDPAWPKPVWGVTHAKPYIMGQQDNIISQYTDWLKQAYAMV